MKMPVRFWRWTGLFAVAGFSAPLFFSFYWRLGGKGAIVPAMYLWPASVEFIDLDAGMQPRVTIYSVWLRAFIENAILYAIFGALLWFLLWAVSRGLSQVRAKPR